ncbi:hypothetical protein DCO49_00025 [Stenotrophomonas sp. SPM]|nr:hypothetical protein DCO49_00025 [Stenotrophomonas sp. SPM]
MARGQPVRVGVAFYRGQLQAVQSAGIVGQGSAQRACKYGIATAKRAGLDETGTGQMQVGCRTLHQYQVSLPRADGRDSGEGAVIRLFDER